MNWAAITGNWEFDLDTITFKGEPFMFTGPDGVAQIGPSVGLAMSNEAFSNGEISADIEFAKVVERSSCEIVFYYDAVRRWHVAAGIGGSGMYVIRHWEGKWIEHAVAGSRQNLMTDRAFHLKVSVRGSRVSLRVDDVEVIAAVVPFTLQPSQTGIWCLDDSVIRISNFEVKSHRGRVFVVMQFSEPFTALYGVIKKVCGEFGLDAHKSDETYGPGLVIGDIAREITQSEFVIAEISPANPNVYYELGYAHAINKPAILLADGQVEHPPFDVASFRIMFYENSIPGRQGFEDGLRKHIEAILEKSSIVPYP